MEEEGEKSCHQRVKDVKGGKSSDGTSVEGQRQIVQRKCKQRCVGFWRVDRYVVRT